MAKDQIEQLVLRLRFGIQPVDEKCDFVFRLRRIDSLHQNRGTRGGQDQLRVQESQIKNSLALAGKVLSPTSIATPWSAEG